VLTERRAAILSMVVDEYVQTAEPVSSRALVERRRLDVSSATIRNELARLEDEGYITHPYTSAGRIPSDLGYRTYVEALMAEDPVSAAEQRTVEHQLHQVMGGLDEWLSLTATILSASVGNAAVVTRPRARSSKLRHAQLVELNRETALLVAVMDDGRVRQRMLPQHEPVTQTLLQERADRLNQRLEGADVAEVRDLIEELHDADEVATVRAIAELIDEQRIAEETYVDGVSSVLRQPEFSDVERMLEAVARLQAYRLRTLLESAVDEHVGSTRVVIGSEHGDAAMQDWSVVVARYGDGDASGAVAVIGPTRMAYGRTIPRVRYVATLMSQLLHEVRQS
jgi:heat-inducible transcriptional repressor